jgi:hypothetical protein
MERVPPDTRFLGDYVNLVTSKDTRVSFLYRATERPASATSAEIYTRASTKSVGYEYFNGCCTSSRQSFVSYQSPSHSCALGMLSKQVRTPEHINHVPRVHSGTNLNRPSGPTKKSQHPSMSHVSLPSLPSKVSAALLEYEPGEV